MTRGVLVLAASAAAFMIVAGGPRAAAAHLPGTAAEDSTARQVSPPAPGPQPSPPAPAPQPSSPAPAPPPVSEDDTGPPLPAEAVIRIAQAGEPGIPLTLNGTVRSRGGQPVAGAALHVYQTDATGWYTKERAMDEPHARIAGRLRTDGQGRFRLLTIRPGGYPQAIRLGDRDRKIPAHIHIDIEAPGGVRSRLQMVFADDPLLEDPYWADWVRRLGQPVITVRPDGRELRGEVSVDLR